MMKVLSMSLLFCGLLGCAPQHYAAIEDDTVALYLEAPQAAQVQFASSKDKFALQPARRDNDGSWVVRGLQDEEFQYFYFVDGKVFIPECRFRENDDFGAANCRYIPSFARALRK